jgi:outer membrane protein TolC
MKIKYILSMLSMAMILCSCGLYSSYKRPQNLPSEGLYRDTIESDDTTSLATLSWRQLFTDHCLVNLIDDGLKHNTDLQKSTAANAGGRGNAATIACSIPTVAVTHARGRNKQV